jgi:putative redox protein
MSLGACTSMTVRLFATHEGLPLEDLRVRLRHKHVHIEDAEDFDAEDRRIEVIDVAIELDGPLTEAQRERLLTIAGRCPVHRTLTGELEIRKRLVTEPDRDEGSV